MTAPRVDIVVPTIGRPSLAVLLRALALGSGPWPDHVFVVDDRQHAGDAIAMDDMPGHLAERIVVLQSGGRGPAAARNVGWRASRATWIAFLDDDVVPDPEWLERLSADLSDLPADVAGSQGVIHVPLPRDRAATDWERDVQGLERARWATADLAYRRRALARVGGFDERFPRAYREDADLGLRITATGDRIVRGRRRITHPVRPADRWISVRRQGGNADDVLMRALHGAGWRGRAGVPRGRRPWHLMVTAASTLAIAAAVGRRRRTAAAAAAVAIAGVAELAGARIAPGPRTRDEVLTMLATSSVLPLVATWHWLRGWALLPSLLRASATAPSTARRPRAAAVDRLLVEVRA